MTGSRATSSALSSTESQGGTPAPHTSPAASTDAAAAGNALGTAATKSRTQPGPATNRSKSAGTGKSAGAGAGKSGGAGIGASGVEDHRLERLINLAFAFLSAADKRNPWITTEWICQNVAGYDSSNTVNAQRMVRRDIATLRKVGVPIRKHAAAESEDHRTNRYKLDSENYSINEVDFTPEEAAVLALAGNVGLSQELAAFARSGWTKIAAAGIDRANTMVEGIAVSGDLSRVGIRNIENLRQGIAKQRQITFNYLPPSATEPSKRAMDPWGLAHRVDRFYLVGFDLTRQAVRCFRITNLSGVELTDVPSTHPKPAEVQLADLVNESLRKEHELISLTLAVKDKGLPSVFLPWVATEGANDDTDSSAGGADSRVAPAPVDSHQVRLVDVDRQVAIRLALEYSQQVTVIAPAELREEVRSQLANTVEALQAPIPQQATVAAAVAPRPDDKVRTNGTEDLVRLLNLLPYFDQRAAGTSLMQAAKNLQVSATQLSNDLDRLFCCGLPGLGPGELVDVDHDWKHVNVRNAQGMDSPLRLTGPEAATLLMALESLTMFPGLVDPTAVKSAAEKLASLSPGVRRLFTDSFSTRENAASDPAEGAPAPKSPAAAQAEPLGMMSGITDSLAASAAAEPVAMSEQDTHPKSLAESYSADAALPISSDTPEQLLAYAIKERRLISFNYLKAQESEPQLRTALPVKLFFTHGHTYLRTWVPELEDDRTFRIDRMSAVQLLPSRGQVPVDAAGELLAFDALDPFDLSDAAQTVRIIVAKSRAWIGGEVPMTVTPSQHPEWSVGEISVSSLEWFTGFVAAQGGQLRIVAPQSVSDYVLKHTELALSAYDSVKN